MDSKSSIKTLKEQAQKVSIEFPELTSLLAERDTAISNALFEMAALIPHPDDLPNIQIPMVPVHEVMRPQDDCPERDDVWLSEKLKAKLRWLCQNGIYLRKTGIAGFLS